MKLKIKELREELQLTQKDLAQRINNVQRNISNWELGVSEPDCETIVMLADIFNVSIDELFGRDYSDTQARMQSNDEKSVMLANVIKRLTLEQRLAVKNMILCFLP